MDSAARERGKALVTQYKREQAARNLGLDPEETRRLLTDMRLEDLGIREPGQINTFDMSGERAARRVAFLRSQYEAKKQRKSESERDWQLAEERAARRRDYKARGLTRWGTRPARGAT